ncbi:MAG: UDP-N-acetylglucosamine 2-epimerase (hydrolyzing), partial [Magnetococcales bacterium]|nr:UDP-N-acetylglucosamine 2-epimerase (hydrolyzing) [Magnetococcales bacterium]
MRKVLGLTASRADYDLMSLLFRHLRAEEGIELKLLVSGAHLSPTFGHGVEQIRRDGFDILLTLETLLDADSLASRIKSAAILLQNAIDVVAFWRPDVLLFAGDREEVIVGGLLGAYLEIPTVHFFGGDHVQDSHVDNPVRHATSKLSTVHMVSLEEHRQRLMRMGEHPERIHCIGSIALDKFREHQPVDLAALRQRFGLPESFADFALVIFHPVAGEREEAHVYFENILSELKARGIPAFVGAPNSDPMNRSLFEVAARYREEAGFCFYRSLDRDLFLSIYKNSRFIIGNSSSGVIEAASVPIPAINVGQRQRGRLAGENVVFCGTS